MTALESHLVDESWREFAIGAIGHRALYQEISRKGPGVLLRKSKKMVKVDV